VSSSKRAVGLLGALVLIGGYALALPGSATASATDPCAAPTNPIVCENSKPGTDPDVWDISGAGDTTIQGFATDMSINVGSPVSFKIKTNASAYKVDIYRLGFYQGNGARLIGSVTPTARTQPACLSDASTGLYDCGNWAVSATWNVPSTAISGVYFALLTRNDTGGQSQIPFVVRDDSSHSAIVMQTSDPTWQAYNTYGGSDFYTGDPAGRSYKVSYNRPLLTRGDNSGRDALFSNEYPMIRFLESNGYDVSYMSGVDTDRFGPLLKNHKTFVSVGHDEYWSGDQRANVESARDAGVNLAFFSGNEVYWKTRWENSIDGSGTPRRTLVCYKETWANSKIDPSTQWTGTWRDQRFSPPSTGGAPENALTGTAFMANHDDLAIQVSSTEGKLRFWRKTTLATMTAGQTATLAADTVGYESDEDLDNGFRPAGAVRLSTTTGETPEYLTDYGPDVVPGVTTHHLMLYRAPSGALVFSAGTIQYAWGLDQNHDGSSTPADPRIQQATVNLFADMGAQPLTPISGMVVTPASTDTSAPTSTITSPTASAVQSNGTRVTVSGTATDTGGGVVAGVEVSTDGGATWHAANGTTAWSYSYIATGSGPVTLKSRASDDSANVETPSAGVTITVNCPCSLFGAAVPATPAVTDTADTELGVRFTPQVGGVVTGVRFYKGTGNTGTHTGTLWSSSGTALATGTFTGESATGWQTMAFSSPVTVNAGVTYVVSYRAPNGHYADQNLFFDYRDYVAKPLMAARSSGGSINGVFGHGGDFPASTFNLDNYYVDVSFTSTSGTPDTTAPVISAVSSSPASTSATVTWSTDEAASSVVNYGTSPAALTSTATVGGLTTSHSVVLSGLSPTTLYYFKVTSADVVNNSATSPTSPATFTTTALGACPCTLFDPTSTPTTPDSADAAGVEVGVKFVSSVAGYVTGVRFYKSVANTGTHTGTLWSATGTALATGTFTNETGLGWQTLTFPTPVALTAGATYVASYKAPNGHYSVDVNFFTTALVNGPLTAPAGTNGVFQYGGGFPNTSFNSGNYWVDPVFMTGTPPPDVTAPVISSVAATPSSTSTTLSWATNEASTSVVSYGTSASALTSTASGAASATSHSVTLTGLSPTTTYYYRVTSADAAGNSTTSPVTSSAPLTFTTTAIICPCTLFPAGSLPGTVDAGDGAAVELGVKFVPTMNGSVSGVRFYKAAANTGTHTGSLWSASGTRLATGTFSGESASGWQTLTFSAPVAVVAGTTYTASYLAPNGHYAADGDYFASPVANGPLTAPAASNGVYLYGGGFPSNTYNQTNYWVDPVMNLSGTDTTAPVISAVTMTPGNKSATISWTTNEAATSVVSYGTSAGSLTSTVSSPVLLTSHSLALSGLAPGVTYYFRVTSVDSSGNSATSPPGSDSPGTIVLDCPCSLFSDSETPVTQDAGEAQALELGVKVVPSVNGFISAVRFYKSSANTGTHTGTLWSSTGTALATGTFANETATGWQTLVFSSPVAVTAGTTYVASYNAPNGHYAGDGSYFTSDLVRGPLTAPAGNNGLFTYGSGFPTSTFNSSNYWVDVVFSTTAPDLTAPTVTSNVPASGASGVATSSTVSAVFSKPVDTATLQFTVKNGSTAVPGAVSYAASTRTATFTPTSALPGSTSLTASVQASDLAGNAMSAPTTWAFATQDATAPTISAVAATGSGTSAVVTWTTNEAATSVVNYGLTATSLTSSATASGSVTAHSVNLTGLTANTRYFYRVVSADPSGNSATSPATSAAAAQYVPTVTPAVQTTAVDFTSGTQAGTYVAFRADGEVTLAPSVTQEFTGTTVPATWSSTSLATGSSVGVAAGVATVSGQLFRTTATYTTSREIDAVATLKPVPGQWLGATDAAFAGTGATSHWAAFRTTPTGTLVAETRNGTLVTTSANLDSSLLGTAHHYEVDWTSTATIFKVDGTTVATLARGVTGSMYLAVQDATVDVNTLLLDSAWLTPYAASGTFTSGLIDAGATVDWRVLTPTATVPTGTTVTYQVRTGPNATAGGTGWSAWTTVAASADMPGTQRYLQYRATLTTNSTRNTAPTLSAIQLGYAVV
jgi:phosphodiesterase/alkaline phosphatase D-like protein